MIGPGRVRWVNRLGGSQTGPPQTSASLEKSSLDHRPGRRLWFNHALCGAKRFKTFPPPQRSHSRSVAGFCGDAVYNRAYRSFLRREISTSNLRSQSFATPPSSKSSSPRANACAAESISSHRSSSDLATNFTLGLQRGPCPCATETGILASRPPPKFRAVASAT